jgi:hypothetical protein
MLNRRVCTLVTEVCLAWEKYNPKYTCAELELEDGDRVYVTALGEGATIQVDSFHESLSIMLKDNMMDEDRMYRAKPQTLFREIANTYAKRYDVDPVILRFVLDGCNIDPDCTCAELGLEDGDKVDVIWASVGC